MSLHLLWKRLITKEVPLSYHPLSIAFYLLPPLPFNANPNSKITHFCTQTAAPSVTPPPLAFNAKSKTKSTHFCTQAAGTCASPLDWGAFTEFLVNKCGFTERDITKTFGHRRRLRLKSIQNLEEVLELLYGCGLTAPAQIRRVVLYNPAVVLYISETNLNSMLSLLRTFMKEEHVSKVVYTYSTVFSIKEHRVKSAVSLLQKLGVEGDFLSNLLSRQPRLLTALEEKVVESFKLAEDLGVKKRATTLGSGLRAFLGVGKETIDRRLQCLRSLGFSEKQILEISSKKPLILGLTEENVKRHVDFLVNSVGFPLADIAKHASLFSLSLEKRMIPRYRVMEALKSKPALKTKLSLPQVFILSERSFLEKYVNSDAEYSSVLRDIYHGGKPGKL